MASRIGAVRDDQMTFVTLRKGTTDHRWVMKTAARRSPRDRDRAVARLRALTIGTSIAGITAVGGFAVIAAISYDGTTTEVTTAAIVSTDTSSAAGGTSSTTTGSTSTTSGSTSTSGSTTSTQATVAPTATTGSAHAATGSS
jgi:hypothetical protein